MGTADRVEERAPSIEKLRSHVQASPGDIEAHRTLGWELYGLKRYEEAKETLQTAADRFPQDAEIRYGLGLVLRGLDEKGDARRSFQKALDLIEQGERTPRTDMMRKLASGHINQIDHGRWDLPDR